MEYLKTNIFILHIFVIFEGTNIFGYSFVKEKIHLLHTDYMFNVYYHLIIILGCCTQAPAMFQLTVAIDGRLLTRQKTAAKTAGGGWLSSSRNWKYLSGKYYLRLETLPIKLYCQVCSHLPMTGHHDFIYYQICLQLVYQTCRSYKNMALHIYYAHTHFRMRQGRWWGLTANLRKY